MADILLRTIDLACSVEHAFEVFTRQIDLWWPRGHRRHGDGTLTLTREALIERAADGSEWVMARVTALEPPHRLALDWFPGSPAAPTSVDIQFATVGTGTRITVTHRAVSAGAEDIWPQRVALFEKGWDAVLPALKTFSEET